MVRARPCATRWLDSTVDQVNIFLAPPDDVLTFINTYYRVLSETDDNIKQFWETAAAKQDVEATVGATDEAPIIQLVNKIVTQALRDRASDIHIEPTDGRIRIRYRIDGALREVLSLPDSTGPELVSRIKIMADMDIVERRRPQDGQFETTIDGAASTCASQPARRSGARPRFFGCSTRAGR